MGNEGSLPVDGVAFDAEEIKRLGKRFKKLVTFVEKLLISNDNNKSSKSFKFQNHIFKSGSSG